MGLAPRLRRLADALAEDVYVAPSATYCGFAGDRGFSHPELTAAATVPQASELAGRTFDAHLSSNRTCEVGLARATDLLTHPRLVRRVGRTRREERGLGALREYARTPSPSRR